jgi:hypothetical protein
LVAALDQPLPVAKERTIELAEDLEFDPTSVRRPATVHARVSAPYSIPLAPATRPSAASRPPASASAPTSAPALAPAPAPMRASAASAPHFVPDLELAPPSVSRRPSGERPVVQPTPAEPSMLDLDSASMPAALDLDLDLPPDEPRAQRSVSSQRLAAVQPSAQRPSNPPPARGVSGSMAAVREPLANAATSGVMSTRNESPELRCDPPRSAGNVPPPASADTSAPFETGFVAKIDPKLYEERSLAQRLRPAIALLSAAIVTAIFDPIYAAATGEVLEIGGQRLSLLAGLLLLLAVGFGIREMTREG